MIRLISRNADNATLAAPRTNADHQELSKINFRIYLLNKTPEKRVMLSKYLMQSVHYDDVSISMQIRRRKILKQVFDDVIY